MYQTPSTAFLIKSTLVALGVALVTLFTVILPAEYNIDPTGVGQKLGLTVLATSVASQMPSVDVAAAELAEDTISVVVPAGLKWNINGQPQVHSCILIFMASPREIPVVILRVTQSLV
jgi:hypothetical protein